MRGQREMLRIDQQEDGAAIVSTAVVGGAPRQAGGNDGQGRAGHLGERHGGAGQLINSLILPELPQGVGGGEGLRGDLSGSIGPGPQPGIGYRRFGPDDLGRVGERLIEGEDRGNGGEVPAMIDSDVIKQSLLLVLCNCCLAGEQLIHLWGSESTNNAFGCGWRVRLLTFRNQVNDETAGRGITGIVQGWSEAV